MNIPREQVRRLICSSEESSALEMEEEVVGGPWKPLRAMRIAGPLLRGEEENGAWDRSLRHLNVQKKRQQRRKSRGEQYHRSQKKGQFQKAPFLTIAESIPFPLELVGPFLIMAFLTHLCHMHDRKMKSVGKR